jgi:ribosomal protein S18 acetylase RimI-like enzyme
VIRLRPLRDDEFGSFFEATRSGYERGIREHAGLPAEAAARKAETDLAALFPGKKPNPKQTVLVIEDVESDDRIGRLWFAEQTMHGRRVAHVYDVEISRHVRGRGLGREAMLRLEDEVRARGLRWIELNVFGGNEAARRLYRSLGYVERAVYMGKELEQP